MCFSMRALQGVHQRKMNHIHVSSAVAQRWEPPSPKVIKARVENMIGMCITRETTQEKRPRDT